MANSERMLQDGVKTPRTDGLPSYDDWEEATKPSIRVPVLARPSGLSRLANMASHTMLILPMIAIALGVVGCASMSPAASGAGLIAIGVGFLVREMQRY